jgi:hypothetical protein
METNIHDIAIKNKRDNFSAVKGTENNSIEGIDLTKRTVKGVLNTMFYIDHDLDMSIPGCFSKSINDNGPDSEAHDKIKYQIDHSLKARDTIGVFNVLKERTEKNITDLYFEGYLPPMVSDDHLIKYQTKLYTQHSIGFRYMDISVAEKDSTQELYRENWAKYYPLAINKEVADQYGYFYIVFEYKLHEGSVVTFGANKLTDYLGSKSNNKETYLFDLFQRMDFLNSIDKNKNSKEFQLEINQIKQIIKETYNREPSIKDTLLLTPSPKIDTCSNMDFLKNLKESINE